MHDAFAGGAPLLRLLACYGQPGANHLAVAQRDPATAFPYPGAFPDFYLTALPATHRNPNPAAHPDAGEKAQYNLEDCTVQNIKARCGTFQVYEDRISRAGRQILLRVVVVPAQMDWISKPDALFFFAGGPGGSIIDMVGTYTVEYGYANMDHDLVFVEQRGVGKSNRLTCPPYDPKLTPEEYGKLCLASLDGDPRFYTTALSVDDFDEARQALGYDQINLIGGSYGGTVVQVYLLRHEDHVRSAIIDHSTLLKIPFMSMLPRSSQVGLRPPVDPLRAKPQLQRRFSRAA